MTPLATILGYISAQKDVFDDTIRRAAAFYYRDHSKDDNFVFDVNECNTESLNLSQGSDLCYDRPNIGFSYSLWYHGRRVNTFLKYFAEVLYNSIGENSERIELFDLGAGTGAIQWAAAICFVAFKKNGIKLPKIRVINVDTSPFMLDYNRSYLWPAFLHNFPDAQEIEHEYSINSWNNVDQLELINPWIVASYLFDHTENKEEIKLDFENIAADFKPRKVILLTSKQAGKIKYLNEVADSIIKLGYQKVSTDGSLLFSGTMHKIHDARQIMQNKSGIKFPRAPYWDDSSLYGVVLSNKMKRMDFPIFEEDRSRINLYNPPLIVRREIRLNDRQKDAAKIDERPTIIVGPAGCGKSVVITERIFNLVTQLNYTPSRKILVTTFNKQLISKLGEWLEDLLESKRSRRVENNETSEFYFDNATEPSIQLMHFDVLPTRIGNLFDGFLNDYQHKVYLNGIVSKTLNDKGLSRDDSYIHDEQFLFDEYHRVWYGLKAYSGDLYESVDRKGRKKPLHPSQRKLVRSFLEQYQTLLDEKRVSSPASMRLRLLKKIEAGAITPIYDYIFVDEFQDCTQADYSIFYGLLKNKNNIIIAGDYAQAVHIGKSAEAPRDDDKLGVKMRNFKWHRLEGSYRLPYRISECIKPVSKTIQLNDNEEADIITPYKGSPPGARPIIVFANATDMANKIYSIVKAYNLFEIINIPQNHKITILEKDQELCNKLNAIQSSIAETDSILRLKGLEKRCIVWSVRVKTEHPEEINNFVYTILTRTSCILIIAILTNQENASDSYKPILKELRQDRLICWDDFSKNEYRKLKNGI